MYTVDFLGIILAITLYISHASATITLGEFQTVAGFPPACENAYNAPISGCDASNFPQKCSSECFYALQQAEALIDNSCAGQQAPFKSIIGQMFEGNGATFMCTSDLTLASSGPSSSTSYYTDATTFSSSTTASSATTSTFSTSTSNISILTTTDSSSSINPISTVTTSSTIRRTSTVAHVTSSSTSSSTSTSTSAQSSTSPDTPTSSSSGSATSIASFLSTAFNNGQATTLSSEAQRTSAASSNPDAFGGGGSPFEIGPNGNGGEKAAADFWLLLSLVFGVMLLR